MSKETQYYIATGQLIASNQYVSSYPQLKEQDARTTLEYRFAVNPKTIQIHPVNIKEYAESETI